MIENVLVLNMLFVLNIAVSQNVCPPKDFHPIDFPPKQMLGVWRNMLCNDTQLCLDLVCAEYKIKHKDSHYIIHGSAYNKSSGAIFDSTAAVILEGQGQYKICKLVDSTCWVFYVIYLHKHFCVLYSCHTDARGVTTPGIWIRTKNNRYNVLPPWEMALAKEVVTKHGMDWNSLRVPDYYDCKRIRKMISHD